MSDNSRNSRDLEKYRGMQRIRRFEDKAEAIHAQGEIPGALHTYAGM
jgi:TPP-dependent pyruvate/acetoin dehydrogenase alpha subunit